ncbi:MAG: GNAT family N-acetyltransferase, partial [Planctomycetota bacterium]
MYSVRELGKDDATVWRALRVRGAELYPEAFLPTAEEARSVSIEQDQAGLAQGGRFALFHDAEAVGIAAIRLMYFSRTRHRATIGPFFI